MNHTRDARPPLTQGGLSIRVLFLSLLLMGSSFAFISTLTTSQIFAQGAPKVFRQHVAKPHSITMLSTKKKLLTSKERLAMRALKGRTDRHGISWAQPTPTADAHITTVITTSPTEYPIFSVVAPAAPTLTPTDVAAPGTVTDVTATPTAISLSNLVTSTIVTPVATDVAAIANTVTTPLNALPGTITNTPTPTGIGAPAVSTSTVATPAPTGIAAPSVSISTVTTPTPTGIAAPAVSTSTVATPAPTGIAASGAITNNVATPAPTGIVALSGAITSTPTPTGIAAPGVITNAVVTPTATPVVGTTLVPTPTPTATATPVPGVVTTVETTPTAISTSTVAPLGNSTLSPYGETITANVIGGPAFQTGQTLTWDVNVSNASASASLDMNAAVTVSDIVPLGLSAITATGSTWSINLTATTGPALITAVYLGPPVAAGAAFPPIEISGILTNDATPSFTDTAAVSDNLQSTTMLTTFSVNVSTPNQTVTPAAVPTTTATVTPTAVPTTTATVTPTAVSTGTTTPNTPQLYITNSLAGNGIYFVGQTINYSLTVGNQTSGAAANQPIIVHDVFSAGLTNIVATGNNWTITLDSTTSPTSISATYNGSYPVAAGAILPVISINGTLTAAAVPSFTSNATVSSANPLAPAVNLTNGAGPLLDTSVSTITVQAAPLVGTPTPTLTPTIAVTPTPTASVTPTITVTPGSAPDLSIVKVNLKGNHFKVGDKVTYVIIVSNPLVDGEVTSPITVTDIIPLGLSDITVKAPLWNTSVSYDTSPAVITADYNGDLPVVAGEVLSPISVTGTLNENAVPSLTDTTTVDTLDNIGDNNTSTDTILVSPSNNHHRHHHDDPNGCDCSNGSDGSDGHNGHDGHDGSNGHNGHDGHNGSNGNDGSSSSPGLPDTGGAAVKDVWYLF